MKRQFYLKHSIYHVITGSHAYGLNIESSDRDEKAIVLLPASFAFTLSNEWETETFHHPDMEFHSLKKAIKLFNSQNPTMLELLFIDKEYIIKETPYSNMLRRNRDIFLSQNCYYSFGGYAKNQIVKLKKHLKDQVIRINNKVYFKQAMHLIRLLLSGIEILESGYLTVYQKKHKNLLLNIRNGKMNWKDIFQLADVLLVNLDKAKSVSPLPEKTETDQINKLYQEILFSNYNIS